MRPSNERVHEVLSVTFLGPGTYRLRCQRAGVAFEPGQCANLGVPGMGINREYSTYSGVAEPDLEFLIRKVSGGIVSQQLSLLGPGDAVELSGFYGDFRIMHPDDGRQYLFIATGTGIAPFRSFVRSYPQLDYGIVHGVRYAHERYDHEEYGPERYTACTSRSDDGHFHGRVTDYLRQHSLDPSAVCYLCGNRTMISEAYAILRDQGVPSNNIFAEVFF